MNKGTKQAAPATPLPTVKALGALIVASDESVVFGKYQEDRNNGAGTRAELIRRANAYQKLVDALRESLQAFDGDFGPDHISTRHRTLLAKLTEAE